MAKARDLTTLEKVSDLIGEPFPRDKQGKPMIRKKFKQLELMGRLDKKKMVQIMAFILEGLYEKEEANNSS